MHNPFRLLPIRGIAARLALLLVLVGIFEPDVVKCCDMESCSATFAARTSGVRRGPSTSYCLPLREYLQCLTGQATACRGDLMYHGTKISVQTLITSNKCHTIFNDHHLNSTVLPPPPPIVKHDPCQYSGPPASPAHCGLFGDPHLKTFNGTFMTCRAKGAWPMVSSAHLAVQVTNDVVSPHFGATAITKATVLIKSDASCGGAKSYEASGDRLPKAFVDGTTRSGRLEAPFATVTERIPGRHVLIVLTTIDAFVSIRKIGKYLSVSVTLPDSEVENLTDDLQLCVAGCPQSEQLQDHKSESQFEIAMSQEKAMSLCLGHNITDYFLDSCVFDLMTTGDLTFRDAASLSLKDMWQEVPKTSFVVLRNCSQFPCAWKFSGQGSVAVSARILVLGFIATVAHYETLTLR